MPHAIRTASCIVVAYAVLGAGAVAHAQSIDPFDPGANQTVWTMAVQADGKSLFGGVFTGLGGGAGTTTRNHIGRINADGSLDGAFNPGVNGDVYAIAVQPDGKILIGGNFTALGGGTGLTAVRSHIGRLNSDGTVDTGFNPGANRNVYALSVQPDGKILIAGDFSNLGGVTRNGLGRLNPDGTPDGFDPGASKPGATPIVYAMALQADGKVVVGGYFNGLGGGTGVSGRNFIGRINADGTIDTGFNPGASSISGVNALAIQADGKILVGGSFTGLGNGSGTTLRSNIGRLNPDGTVDGFNPGAESQVLTLAIQVDGKILAGGYFKWLGAAGGPARSVRNYIGRLNPDGSVDTFNPGAGNVVTALTLQPDGNILAAGLFATVGGGTGGATSRKGIARITNSAGAFESLNLNGGALTWLRSGTGPELAGVTFEMSTDFVTLTSLGAATRVAGGWELAGLSLSNTQHLFIRVRGSYGSGYQTGSGSLLESFFEQAGTLAPRMSVDKTALVFTGVSNGLSFNYQTGTQNVRLTQTGTGTVSWTASSTTPWLAVSPTSGTGSATLAISAQFAAGFAASQSGSITLTFAGASNQVSPVTATLNVLTSPMTLAPVGSIDTPIDNTTGVNGSIGVTGWALDDVRVTSVRIMRDPVSPEPAGSLVFIGNAVFIDGARPDVQAAFPAFPLSARAGWGYLMLTNFLPGGGNGTFKLYAIVDDVDGHSIVLGPRTITCNNAAATGPFGAIDTPGQGDVISGAAYNNFGWVLSPGSSRADPPGGGTVTVLIDGAPVGTPGGWTSRSDLSTLFPVASYSGVNSAAAAYTFSSLAYANGVHTIAWVVTATSGGQAGVGSRFFSISNGALYSDPAERSVSADGSMVIAARATIEMPPGRWITSRAALSAEVNRAPADSSAIRGRHGYDLEAPLVSYRTVGGRATIQSEEMDRVELALSVTADDTYTGYLRTPDGLSPLPVGSMLDGPTGSFLWQPGVGFIGPYDLLFVRWSGGRAVSRQDVRIVINPKGSQHAGPRIVIDTPSAAADALVQPFLVAGWAADLDAPIDRGVDAVHVWVYPVSACAAVTNECDPFFLGAAAFGGVRPDVAAVYGERFAATGYGLFAQGLPPGTYDLAVFAYSTVTGRFAPAKTMRVTVR